MMYLLLKALHIVAVIIWVGGILTQAFLLRTIARQPLPSMPDERSVIGAAVRWDQYLFAPAMLVAWGCGLALASIGQWWGAPWLIAKLALVLAISVLHGFQAGTLRRMADAPARRTAGWPRQSWIAPLGVLALIVLLVVVKPARASGESAAGALAERGQQHQCGMLLAHDAAHSACE